MVTMIQQEICYEYYMSLVEMHLIDNKPFFNQPIKNNQEAYEKPVKMSRNNGKDTRLN